ncbi:MAG: hypothetical protein K0U63_06075 [Cyanobacteria bacterium]|nr:hypothetical protein [Cyanobacteriota bacterium]
MSIPLLWINLDRAPQRRARMAWAIRQGGWQAQRFPAVDGQDRRQRLLAWPNPLCAGTALPGLRRLQEPQPWRRTSRAELACLASWKRLLLLAAATPSPSGWLLLMEDDLGASLAAPGGWAHALGALIASCPPHTLAIQLAPISGGVRRELHQRWLSSGGRCLCWPKQEVRSHGNGAVLLQQRAIPQLMGPLERLCARGAAQWHPLSHPWQIRPVADKWLYGALPAGSCQVATYPHFCLEAADSSLHQQHVAAYHRPSRAITLELWRR